MNDKLIVDTDGIRDVANGISGKKEEMLNIYKTQILPMLNSSKDYLDTAGLDFDAVISAFQDVFGSLDGQLGDLSTTLTDKVIPQYEETSAAVTEMFNNQFANDMSDLLAALKK